MDKLMEFLDLKEIVLLLLDQEEECRNSDMHLIGRVWTIKNAGNPYWTFKTLQKMPNPESIIRVRAFIQNTKGLFLPTDKRVYEKRRFNEQEVKDFVTILA
jgi:hypothetical protein